MIVRDLELEISKSIILSETVGFVSRSVFPTYFLLPVNSFQSNGL